MNKKIGFIGAGNMAQAIIRGIRSKESFKDCVISVSDINSETLGAVCKNYNVKKIADNNELVNSSDIIFLAIKPQQAETVLNEIKDIQGLSDKLFVSIMAGKTISSIKLILGDDSKIIRIMPNMLALIGKGMSVISKDANVSDADSVCIGELFAGVGKMLMLEEDKMDVVTAISGSGPAYVFYLAEALIASGVRNGLSCEEASLLAKQTIAGSGALMLDLDETPEALRKKVTSPGGTTEAAIKIFNDNNFSDIILNAVEAAKNRSIELSGGN